LAIPVYGENYLETIIREEMPRYASYPPSVWEFYGLGKTARSQGDHPTAVDSFRRAIEDADRPGVDPRVQTHLQATLAHTLEFSNRHPEAIKVMERLKKSRIMPEDERIRFLIDLEICRAMAQSGGHPNIPEFDPTIFEIHRKARKRRLLLLFKPFLGLRSEARKRFW
jgi:hypothetical protein